MNSSPSDSRLRYYLSAHGETLAVALLIIGFAALVLIYPKLPGIDSLKGLIEDEHLAAQIREMIKERSFWELFWSGQLPSSRDDYHSVLMAYLYLPFLAVVGRSWMFAKYWALVLAIPTMIFAYLFLRNLYNKKAALWALAFLVIHPTYILGIRVGSALLSHMQFFSMGALCFLSFWWTTKRTGWLFFALFFLGMGMCTNVWFYWILTALMVNAVLFAKDVRDRFNFRDGRRLARLAGVGCLVFLCGASLVVYREIVHEFRSVVNILPRLYHFVTATEPGSHFFEHAARTLHVFTSYLASRQLIDGTLSYRPEESPLFPFANELYPWFILACVIFLLSKPALSHLGKKAVFLPVTLAVMFSLTFLFDAGGAHHHFFFLYPVPQLVVGVAVFTAWDLKPRKGAAALLAALLVLIGVCEAWTAGKYLVRFVSVRHGKYHTDIIYDVAEWLKARNLTSGPLLVFEGHEEVPRRLYFILPDSKFEPVRIHLPDHSTPAAVRVAGSTVREAAGRQDVLFIRYANEIHTAFMYNIRRRLESENIELNLLAEFRSPRNEPAFEIYSVRVKTGGPA